MTAEIWKARKNIPFMCFQWLGCLCTDSSTSPYVAFNGFLHTAELRDGSRKCGFILTNYNGGSEERYLLLVCEELDTAPVHGLFHAVIIISYYNDTPESQQKIFGLCTFFCTLRVRYSNMHHSQSMKKGEKYI